MSDDHDDLAPDAPPRWPLTHRGLLPFERMRFFSTLYDDVCMLRGRYRLPVRKGWWESEVQIETLAALAAWVARFDSGEWDCPIAKVELLEHLDRISPLLRDGADPFHPDRDRTAFVRYVVDEYGAQAPSPVS
jgi:hypothetical protein